MFYVSLFTIFIKSGGLFIKFKKKHKKHKFWQSFSSLSQVLSPNLCFFRLYLGEGLRNVCLLVINLMLNLE